MLYEKTLSKHIKIKLKNNCDEFQGTLTFSERVADACQTRTLTSECSFILDDINRTPMQFDFGNVDTIHYL